MSGANSYVQTVNVTKSFRQGATEVKALNDVSLDLAQGEFVAIMGASGSGKSTMLHLLAGLTTPTSGRVVIAGQDLAELNDRDLTVFRRRQIGLVFQAYNLVPTLSLEDNMQLPLLMERGGKIDPAKTTALLDALGLSDRRRHRPDQLSGGEQQRVAIGRALINDPSLVLADEPTGNLDSGNRQRFFELLRTLCASQKRTVVTVTHDPAVALWAERILLLKDGRLLTELRSADYPSVKELGAHFLELMETGVPGAVGITRGGRAAQAVEVAR